MTHNRKPCAVLFLEVEYKPLTLEAYWEFRVVTTGLDDGRHPFSCIHYKKTHIA